MYDAQTKKISKTGIGIANCDVENLDHQNRQLLEGRSYITSTEDKGDREGIPHTHPIP